MMGPWEWPLTFSCLVKKINHVQSAFFYFISLFSEQIKEAADIIQKLHLIAQELPFDRWAGSDTSNKEIGTGFGFDQVCLSF